MKVQGKVVVVTGGGAGMGRFLVLELIKRGANVAMADINEDYMRETSELAGNPSNLSTHVLDVSDEKAVFEFPQKIIDTHGTVDMIINNAGIIQPFIPVSELPLDRIRKVMDINFYGTLYMTKAFLPILLKRPEGHIANVGSMGGFIPFPGQTAYCASKAAIKLLSEGLNVELMNTNVRVTLLQPGGVATEITKNSEVDAPKMANADQIKNMLQPDKAAQIMLDAIESNKFRVFIGKDSKMLNFIYRFFPTWISKVIAKKMGQN
jgi:short-subunit dehydrogenase